MLIHYLSNQWLHPGPYNFWSSAWGEGLAGIVKISVLFAILRPFYKRLHAHFECHVDGCTHLGHPVHGTGYRACHEEDHHPGIEHEPGEPVTAQHIKDAHARYGR